jgi:hypothetical protein
MALALIGLLSCQITKLSALQLKYPLAEQTKNSCQAAYKIPLKYRRKQFPFGDEYSQKYMHIRSYARLDNKEPPKYPKKGYYIFLSAVKGRDEIIKPPTEHGVSGRTHLEIDEPYLDTITHILYNYNQANITTSKQLFDINKFQGWHTFAIVFSKDEDCFDVRQYIAFDFDKKEIKLSNEKIEVGTRLCDYNWNRLLIIFYKIWYQDFLE